MNLLTDAWIPIQQQGKFQKLTLQHLLCHEQTGELWLPRDDMELACLQLLCAMTQVLFTPKDKKALGQRIRQPLTETEYQQAIEDKQDWFDLNHSETPFMQFKNVRANKITDLDKILAGVADGTNKTFVNQPNLGSEICGGCVAIALFNMANNAPSVGGGFQGSFRGNTPITIFIRGKDLRTTLWLNTLTEENILKVMPWYEETKNQKPNYIDKVDYGSALYSSKIGLIRGLLWQPAHYELMNSNSNGKCSCCGSVEQTYTSFKKEKFKYSVEGYWPHPLSPTKFGINNEGNKAGITYRSFTTSAPAWTHLSSLLFENKGRKEGSSPPPIIEQFKSINKNKKLNMMVGGYRYRPPQTATITERRHDLFSLSSGWNEHENTMRMLITTALDYKKALRRALFSFVSQSIINPVSKKNKDRIGEICSITEKYYYQQTESLVHIILSGIRFEEADECLKRFQSKLKKIVVSLFHQATEPYRQEPKMLKALALARRSLHKSLKELEPEGAES